MHATTITRLGATLAGTAVLLGAFAAHGLKNVLAVEQLTTFETAVRYQMYHALALMLCGLLGSAGHRTRSAAIAFLVGIVLFCGSLYGLAMLELKWLGPVTPLGGVSFLIGWLLLALQRRGPVAASATR
jgi:uncharacterized membrane protein YgdD (TMEM256/DUF423 family)